MAKCVGTNGIVLAVEPIPELANYLRNVAKWFPDGHIRTLECVLSSSNGKAMFHFAGYHLGCASIELTDDVMRPPIEVATRTLDACLSEHIPGRAISFIKCDVERHELAVFQGARDTLLRDKPILLFESANLIDEPLGNQPVFELLESLGYKRYFLDESHLPPLSDFDPALHVTPRGNQNFVFTHPERVDRNAHFLVSSTAFDHWNAA